MDREHPTLGVRRLGRATSDLPPEDSRGVFARPFSAEWLRGTVLYLAWVQACIATFGSLYFSEVMDLTPCVLCWYQRILMYPLSLIIAIGILRRDQRLYLYVLPLAVVGLMIAVYHNLLYFRILPESVQPCLLGVSCTTRQIEWLGFITIPLMSLTAFSVITSLMLAKLITRSDQDE